MTKPVTPARVAAAIAFGLENVPEAALACREAGLPFWAACALLEKESHGRNVYGHDVGGALSGYPGEVDESNFAVFQWLVFNQHAKSNGVGPCQITWQGYLSAMEGAGLAAWDPHDNMVYGFGILAEHHQRLGTWEKAGAAYNGRPSYGADFLVKCNEWRARLGAKGTVT